MPAPTKRQRIIDDLTELIDKAAPDTQLPTTSQLVEKYDPVSIPTIRDVMKVLTATGKVYLVPGKGLFVAKRPS